MINPPFPTRRHVLTPLQQTTFETIVRKGEIAQNEEFLLLPHSFWLYFIIYLSFLAIFHICNNLFSKLSAADILYVGKGKTRPTYRSIMMNLPDTTFENIVTKGVIFHFATMFSTLFKNNTFIYKKNIHSFAPMYSKLFAADILYVEKRMKKCLSFEINEKWRN